MWALRKTQEKIRLADPFEGNSTWKKASKLCLRTSCTRDERKKTDVRKRGRIFTCRRSTSFKVCKTCTRF